MNENATTIECNEPLADRAWRLRFRVEWPSYDPGQFVMVGIPGNAVFLRRPFGIAGLAKGIAEVCYKVVGRGTEALTRAPVGSRIDITGPCGRGFAMPAAGETPVLVAGGYGIGPLLGLAQRLIASQQRPTLCYGARTAADLLYREELSALGAEVVLATEDGSLGERGLVTTIVEKHLGMIQRPHLFACGPHGLLAAVARIGRGRKIPAQVSTEAYMACGIGVCMGCVCKDRNDTFVRTCREGPVFTAEELTWDDDVQG